MSAQYQLSKEKKQELEAELKDLIEVKRKEVAGELEDARALGDLSENAEYHAAREAQAETEARIIELESILKDSIVIKHNKTDKVAVGSQVELQKKGTKNSVVYTVVDTNETDIAQQKIAADSPLGIAMVGKKVGDSFELKVGDKNKTTYKIISLS